MSCLATKQVETCNCSEPRFPTNSYACLSVQQRKFYQLSLVHDSEATLNFVYVSCFFGKYTYTVLFGVGFLFFFLH